MNADYLAELLLKIDATVRGGDIVAPCPLCQRDETEVAEYKVSVTPGKKYLFVCYCLRCCNRGFQGMTKEWWRRYLEAHEIDYRQLLCDEDICKILWRDLNVNDRPVVKKVPAAPIDILNKAYSNLLNQLPVTEQHEKWLVKRGIDNCKEIGYGSSDFVIEKGSFQYAPISSFDFTNIELNGVPGFSKNKVNLRYPAILIPSRDYYGRIQAIKQRLLDGKGPRMRWLASGEEGAPKVVNNIHYPIGSGYPSKYKELWITEGERKADCLWNKKKVGVIAVPGVGNTRLIEEAVNQSLEEKGTVVLAFDKDEAGEAATTKAADMLRNKCIVKVAKWSSGKGIDDALVLGSTVIIEDCEETKFFPTPQCTLDSKVCSIDDLVSWLKVKGSSLRKKVPAPLDVITRAINKKAVKFKYTPEGQVLFV